MKRFISIVLAAIMVLSLGSCSLFAVTTFTTGEELTDGEKTSVGIIGGADGPTQVIVGTPVDADKETEPSEDASGDGETVEAQNPQVTITMENGDVIIAELYPDIAPNTVNNFISLVEQGFYDGLIFHRIIQGFMLQGGDPEGTGLGGPGYSIKGEFTSNGFENTLKHTPGVLSMARATNPDSAGSQFFIMSSTSDWLDGEYAAFGKVIEGMDVVYRLETVQTDSNDRPTTEQKIATVTVDTFGVDYPDPEIIK